MFSELLGENGTERKPERKAGLFESLIGDPTIIFQSLLDDPARYEDGVAELLQELIYRRKRIEDLTEEELELLNRAALEFTQGKPTKKELPLPAELMKKAPMSVRAALGDFEDDDEPDLEFREVGRPQAVAAPIVLPPTPPSFWWKQKGQ